MEDKGGIKPGCFFSRRDQYQFFEPGEVEILQDLIFSMSNRQVKNPRAPQKHFSPVSVLPASVFVLLSQSSKTLIFKILTSVNGRSNELVGTAAIASMTSKPLSTSPNTV